MKLPLLLLLLGLPMVSMAHGGRTAADGCHMEHATSARHCHGVATTEPAHVHAPAIAVAALPVVAPACMLPACQAVAQVHPIVRVPEYWNKDVGVEQAPSYWSKDVRSEPVHACPDGAVGSNLIIDQHHASCSAAAVCTSCTTSCAAGCGQPVVRVEVDDTSRIAARRAVVDPSRHSFYFRNCEEAFTAGRAPLHRGDDGYRAELDEDGDGMACDPMVMW